MRYDIYATFVLIPFLCDQIFGQNESKFICQNQTEIEFSRICDGVLDCSNGDDESRAICSRMICPSNAFRCLYGGCISKLLRCNGETDCIDGSDEYQCNNSCKKHEFTCFSGDCIPENQLCDKSYDCEDKSDENEDICKKNNCPDNTFHCRIGGCISEEVLCDGIKDCYDGSDESEILCTKNQIFCPPIESSRIESKCEIPIGPKRGVIPCDKQLPVGTVVRYECKEYFLPVRPEDVNNSKIICQADGSWNREPLKCKPDCGKIRLSATPLILHGSKVTQGSHPWYAPLFMLEEGKMVFFCGGTLITERLVLTAAHCVWNMKENEVLVGLGKISSDFYKNESNAQIVSVIKIYIHPLYQDVTGNYGSDIALLTLVKPVVLSQFILPACIAPLPFNEDLVVNQLGVIAGMGVTENDTFSAELRTINLPVVNDTQCINKQNRDFRKYITFTSFCAGWGNGSGVCNGDSGSGLLFPLLNEADKFAVQGITSISPRRPGTSLCDSSFYTIFTKVNLYLHWIHKIILKTHGDDTIINV